MIIGDYNTSMNFELDYVDYTGDPHKASRNFLHGLQEDGVYIDVYRFLKKEPFVIAKFATENDARTFEHQMSVARKNKAIKIKTFRCDPKIDPAFPIPHWQTVLDKLKQDAKSRVDALLNQHNENEETVAKNL